MGFFVKNRKTTGWLAVRLHADGISACSVAPHFSGMPAVKLIAFYSGEKNSHAAILDKLAKEVNASHFDCLCLLGADEYQIMSVEAPNVQPEELKTAIRWRLKDMLDFRVDDATIDVLDIPAEKNSPVRQHNMYAVAARNSLIEQRQTLFSDAKIPLSVIDIPEMAQRNISALLEPDGRGLAILSFDDEGGLLTVTFGGELYLSRRIDVVLSEVLLGGDEQRNIGFEKITLELQRSFDHFDRQYHFIALSKLMLAPVADNITDLRDHLAANLYVPVENMDLAAVFDLSAFPELRSKNMQQRHFLSLGAALRHEEKTL